MKRARKITLAEALKHQNHDFSAKCYACGGSFIITREEVLAMGHSGTMRVDELEAETECRHCAEYVCLFQVSVRGSLESSSRKARKLPGD